MSNFITATKVKLSTRKPQRVHLPGRLRLVRCQGSVVYFEFPRLFGGGSENCLLWGRTHAHFAASGAPHQQGGTGDRAGFLRGARVYSREGGGGPPFPLTIPHLSPFTQVCQWLGLLIGRVVLWGGKREDVYRVEGLGGRMTDMEVTARRNR